MYYNTFRVSLYVLSFLSFTTKDTKVKKFKQGLPYATEFKVFSISFQDSAAV